MTRVTFQTTEGPLTGDILSMGFFGMELLVAPESKPAAQKLGFMARWEGEDLVILMPVTTWQNVNGKMPKHYAV